MGEMKVAKQCPVGRTVLLITIAGLGGVGIGCLAMWCGIHFSFHTQLPLSRETTSGPNFVIFLADDVGYGDFQVYGHPTQEWTGVDRMAKEGKRFTHFYTPVAVCSPSRAAILTGRYPVRTGVYGQSQVFAHFSSGGLPRREVTVAEVLKEDGYLSGITGKWHLGINKYNNTDGYHLPSHHGFDAVKTILPFTQHWFCRQDKSYIPGTSDACFLYKSDQIVEQPINLGSLTSKLLNDTINFITSHKDDRFFYLMSFPQTHEALFSNRRFRGKSKRGPYGDSINEMGWAINEVLDHLVKLGIDSKTFALFLSDHGAARRGCGEDGSNGPFRGEKYTTWEGGVRVPAVSWWPGVIEPNSVSRDVLSTMDILPTFLKLANRERRISSRIIDGTSFVDIIIKKEVPSSEASDRPLFFYCSNLLTAALFRNYKIHYYASSQSSDALVNEGHAKCLLDTPERVREYGVQQSCEKNFVKQDPPLMFNLESDIEEHIALNPKSQQYQKILAELKKQVDIHVMSIEDVESEINKPFLPMLRPCCDPPVCMCNYEE